MRSDIERLHSAARQYCEDQYRVWSEKYSRLAAEGGDRNGYYYTPEAYRTFPRYQVLDAVRTELERLTGADLEDIDEARDLLVLAGETAQSDSTEYDDRDAQQAVAEERQKFVDHLRSLSKEQIESTEVLPWKRVLSPEEADQIWSSLEGRWGLKRREYWYPLRESKPDEVEAVQDSHFLEAFTPPKLREVLRNRGVERLWELREYGPEYELDVELFDPCYTGAEGFWTSAGDPDWIVYASHESSITVGGWLLGQVQRDWTDWAGHLWTSPLFD